MLESRAGVEEVITNLYLGCHGLSTELHELFYNEVKPNQGQLCAC